jgi:adenosyl cobinamide kinase/adenosyl cobinamide phosphate guanylyltransferase
VYIQDQIIKLECVLRVLLFLEIKKNHLDDDEEADETLQRNETLTHRLMETLTHRLMETLTHRVMVLVSDEVGENLKNVNDENVRKRNAKLLTLLHEQRFHIVLV